MVNMANTGMKREASESRSQEARMLEKEAVRIDMRLKFMLGVENVEWRQVLEVASPDLQDYIFKNFYSGSRSWKEVLENLQKEARNEQIEEEERVERNRMYEEVIRKTLEEFKERRREESFRLYREKERDVLYVRGWATMRGSVEKDLLIVNVRIKVLRLLEMRKMKNKLRVRVMTVQRIRK